VTGGNACRLAFDDKNYFLHRLLCKNREEIDLNIKHAWRITDYDTRVFSALNSIKYHGSNPVLRYFCIVSIGYTSIVANDNAVCEILYDKIKNMLDEIDPKVDIDAACSYICLSWHMAIFKQDAEFLRQIAIKSESFIDFIDQSPDATANAIRSVLVFGAFYYLTGNSDVARRFFDQGDILFRSAANNYPRSLVRYPELVDVCKTAYACQIGAVMARGDKLPPAHEAKVEPLSATTAIRDAGRLYNGPAMASLIAKFIEMINNINNCA
jgi:hypothetical protein